MSTKKVTIGYKFRIYPTKEQEVLFAKTFGCTRYVYNYFLNLRNTQYSDNHISLSRYDCIKLLPPMKSCEETIWLKEADSIALQSSIEYLDEGFKRFFEDIKKPKDQRRGVGKPKFKSKHGKQSLVNMKYQHQYHSSSLKDSQVIREQSTRTCRESYHA